MIDCKITKNYIREKYRMTDTCYIDCLKCPLSFKNNSYNVGCGEFENTHTDEAIEIVQKWSDEHPQKTYKDDFYEKFPNAKLKSALDASGVCRYDCYGRRSCSNGCVICWNEVME